MEFRRGLFRLVVRIVLLTGRKHQIRIQLPHIGHPILGDKLKGGEEKLYLAFVNESLIVEKKIKIITKNKPLHAGRVTFRWFGTIRTFSCKPEAAFRHVCTMGD